MVSEYEKEYNDLLSVDLANIDHGELITLLEKAYQLSKLMSASIVKTCDTLEDKKSELSEDNM